jgi:hypothetical protein
MVVHFLAIVISLTFNYLHEIDLMLYLLIPSILLLVDLSSRMDLLLLLLLFFEVSVLELELQHVVFLLVFLIERLLGLEADL